MSETSPNTISQELDVYIDKVADHYCKYLEKSKRIGALYKSAYTIDSSSYEEVLEQVSTISIHHTEQLRYRRLHTKGDVAALSCELVEFKFVNSEFDHEKLLSQVHSKLMNMYTSKGIVFGQFPAGSENKKIGDDSWEVSPASFVAIRNSLPNKDTRFFANRPALASSLEDSCDDGNPVSHDSNYMDIWNDIHSNHSGSEANSGESHGV